MDTTTDYGTWANHGDSTNVSVEASIADALSGGEADWRERVEESGAAARIAADWRAAINAALPDGITLAGNRFYGPYDDRPDVDIVDIVAVVAGVDLDAIIDRHDPDQV